MSYCCADFDRGFGIELFIDNIEELEVEEEEEENYEMGQREPEFDDAFILASPLISGPMVVNRQNDDDEHEDETKHVIPTGLLVELADTEDEVEPEEDEKDDESVPMRQSKRRLENPTPLDSEKKQTKIDDSPSVNK